MQAVHPKGDAHSEFDPSTTGEPHYRELFASPVLTVADIRWRGSLTRRSEEFTHSSGEITFQRRGMFYKNHGPQRVACDANTLIFIDPGETYCLTHPVELDCACTALYVPREQVDELARRAGLGSRREGSFGLNDGPGGGPFAARRLALEQALRHRQQAGRLYIEETGLGLAEAAVATAAGFCARRPRPVRDGTRSARRDMVQSVKELLARHWQTGIGLPELSAAAHCAATHLCRVFREETGAPMHRYLTRLRLLHALELLWEPRQNLMKIALQCGFTHHSHFTRHFRREFGLSPSRFRREVGAASLRSIRNFVTA